MNKNKSTLNETFLEALDNYKKKKFKITETLCHKILSINTNHLDSKILLSNIAAKNNDYNQDKIKKASNIEVLTISNLMGEAIKRISNSTSVSDLFK